MVRPLVHACLVVTVIAGACDKSKPDTTPTAGGGDAPPASPTCEPGRCLDDISKLVAERRGDARACYDTARQRDPKLAGKLIVNFAIDSQGMVGETSQGMQDGQIEDAALLACVSEVIKTIRFAASPAGKTTRAYHRFELTP